MKILLISPGFTEIYGNYAPAAKVGVLWPPMGIAYIAAVLEKEGHEVKIIDLEVESLSKQKLTEKINTFSPKVIGVSSSTPLHHKAIKIFQLIKEINKNIITLSGGPHPTTLPFETMKNTPEIDFICYGESELTVAELIKYFEKRNEQYENIRGLVWREGDEIKVNPRRELIEDLDTLPFPARHLLNYKKYLWSVPGKGIIPITSFMTSRGCPFLCTFCSQHVLFGRKMRYRSIPSIIEELKLITKEYKINHLTLLDDTLGVDKKRTFELCEEIKKSGIKVTFEGYTRVNVITKELLQKLKEVGLNRLSFGVESGNQEMLNAVKKGINLQQIREAYKIADSLNIETRMSIIFGLPYETKATIKKTIRFMKSLKCYQAYVNVGTPFPGTKYYEDAKNGVGGLKLLTEDWNEYRRWGNAVIEVNDLKPKDLVYWQKRALLEFYLRPKQIVYNLRRAGIKAAFRNGASFFKSFIK